MDQMGADAGKQTGDQSAQDKIGKIGKYRRRGCEAVSHQDLTCIVRYTADHADQRQTMFLQKHQAQIHKDQT